MFVYLERLKKYQIPESMLQAELGFHLLLRSKTPLFDGTCQCIEVKQKVDRLLTQRYTFFCLFLKTMSLKSKEMELC